MSRLRLWSRDLRLGTQLAFRGARMRTALTATGIGLGVGVLLFAASLPNAIHQRDLRRDARTIWSSSTPSEPPPASDRTALVSDTTTIWKGDRVSGILIDADGSQPPVPPGVARAPAPGELYVSPKLAAMLRDPDARLLRERLRGRVAGTIAPAALSGPAERFYYAGTDDLPRPAVDPAVLRIERFGNAGPNQPLDPFLRLLVLIGAVVLLFPIAILVSTAARFGSERRDRRLAALRLVGTSREETARIAAGESLAAALLGLVAGAALFVSARALLGHVEAYGYSLFPGDVRPDPLITVAIVAGVLLVTVGATLASMRRVVVEPLSVARRGRTARRRVWWRPLPTVAGLVCLLPLLREDPTTITFNHQTQLIAGTVLMLTGLVAILPWLIEASVRRLRGWSVGSQLAVRNLQSQPASSARIVSGIAVAIAGAIALQMLLTIAARDPVVTPLARTTAANATVQLQAPSRDIARVSTSLRSLPGVRSAWTASVIELQTRRHGAAAWSALVIGDCATLRGLTDLRACDPSAGTVVRGVPRGGQRVGPGPGVDPSALPTAGERVKALNLVAVDAGASRGALSLRLPSELPTVRVRASVDGSTDVGIYATTGALPLPAHAPTAISSTVRLDDDDPLALERLRTAAAQLAPTASVYDPRDDSDAAALSAVKRVLLAAATLLLMLIAASLVVTTLEQLGERRRSLATLAAFGTPRAILRRALWWQTAIPVALGLALAVVIGTTLGALLLRLQDEPVRVDLVGNAGLLALGAAMVVAVTAAALPVLRRVAAPHAMRTE